MENASPEKYTRFSHPPTEDPEDPCGEENAQENKMQTWCAASAMAQNTQWGIMHGTLIGSTSFDGNKMEAIAKAWSDIKRNAAATRVTKENLKLYAVLKSQVLERREVTSDYQRRRCSGGFDSFLSTGVQTGHGMDGFLR